MKTIIKSGGLFLLLLGLMACGNKDPFPYDISPELRLISAGPEILREFQDSLIVVLEYKDGDGDIGFENPDSAALWVQDIRLSKPDPYFVKPLSPPNGEQVSIQGTLRFRLRGTFIFGNADMEKTVFKIRLKDRAGHWSEEVSTPEITIVK